MDCNRKISVRYALPNHWGNASKQTFKILTAYNGSEVDMYK